MCIYIYICTYIHYIGIIQFNMINIMYYNITYYIIT